MFFDFADLLITFSSALAVVNTIWSFVVPPPSHIAHCPPILDPYLNLLLDILEDGHGFNRLLLYFPVTQFNANAVFADYSGLLANSPMVASSLAVDFSPKFVPLEFIKVHFINGTLATVANGAKSLASSLSVARLITFFALEAVLFILICALLGRRSAPNSPEPDVTAAAADGELELGEALETTDRHLDSGEMSETSSPRLPLQILPDEAPASEPSVSSATANNTDSSATANNTDDVASTLGDTLCPAPDAPASGTSESSATANNTDSSATANNPDDAASTLGDTLCPAPDVPASGPSESSATANNTDSSATANNTDSSATANNTDAASTLGDTLCSAPDAPASGPSVSSATANITDTASTLIDTSCPAPDIIEGPDFCHEPGTSNSRDYEGAVSSVEPAELPLHRMDRVRFAEPSRRSDRVRTHSAPGDSLLSESPSEVPSTTSSARLRIHTAPGVLDLLDSIPFSKVPDAPSTPTIVPRVVRVRTVTETSSSDSRTSPRSRFRTAPGYLLCIPAPPTPAGAVAPRILPLPPFEIPVAPRTTPKLVPTIDLASLFVRRSSTPIPGDVIYETPRPKRLSYPTFRAAPTPTPAFLPLQSQQRQPHQVPAIAPFAPLPRDPALHSEEARARSLFAHHQNPMRPRIIGGESFTTTHRRAPLRVVS